MVVGNDELGEPLGASIKCRMCGIDHAIEFGERILPDGRREESRSLSFYRCGKAFYLAGIDGRELRETP